MATLPARHLLSRARDAANDPLYRGSLVLLVNTGLLAVGGFAFWGLAARAYPAGTVGTFSGLTAGISLLSTVAALGVPNTITRHLSRTPNQRGLVSVSLAAVTALGGALAVIVVLGLGPHLPSSLHLQQRGGSLSLFTALVVLTALNAAISAALVVYRATSVVLWTNLAGSVVRLIALVALSSLRSSGLILAFSAGLLLSTVLAVPALISRLAGHRGGGNPLGLLRSYLAGTLGNYIATIFGMLPSTVVPLEALALRGPAQTAPLTIALLVAGFLNVIPSTGSQVMFAEASRSGPGAGRQLRKATRAIYAVLIPAVAILVAAAPLILRAFGASYAAAGTNCLRILALATVITAGNYLIDSTLLALDRVAAYLFMNGANAVLVLGCVGVLLRHGLTGGAEGWALAQALSLLLGLTVMAVRTPAARTTAGRPPAVRRPAAHRAAPRTTAARKAAARTTAAARKATPCTTAARKAAGRTPAAPRSAARVATISWDVADLADEPPLRIDLSAQSRTTVPLWLGPSPAVDGPLQSLCGRLARPPAAGLPRQRLAPPGAAMLCGIWYPSLTVSCGPGQVRTSAQLPVLVVVSAYSGWIEARPLPTGHAPDLFAGCWHAFERLGGVPRALVLQTEALAAEFQWFCHSAGVAAAPANVSAEGVLFAAYAWLEQAFESSRAALPSPARVTEDLARFLAVDNARPAQRLPGSTTELAPAELAITDRERLRPLPAQPDGTRWRIEAVVGLRPYVPFDGNYYSVPPAVMGRRVVIIADLATVRVLGDGELVAEHPRSWSVRATIAAMPLRTAPVTGG